MTDKEKIEKLSYAFEETIWMAIRYANGRSTYAPSAIRDAIGQYQMVFPDWKPRYDMTIRVPKKEDLKKCGNFESDFLHDIFN